MTATADAVLLIAFGGPTRSEEIRPFLANVVRGREHRIPTERIEEVVHHYEVIGGRSPLNEITLRQAARLETALAADGPPLPVFVGMRNWAPYLADTFARMAETGVQQAIGVILAPHAVEASRERYIETIDAARTALGTRAPAIRYVAPWYAHPLFITAVADAVWPRWLRFPPPGVPGRHSSSPRTACPSRWRRAHPTSSSSPSRPAPSPSAWDGPVGRSPSRAGAGARTSPGSSPT